MPRVVIAASQASVLLLKHLEEGCLSIHHMHRAQVGGEGKATSLWKHAWVG